jgi:hypothetical protein
MNPSDRNLHIGAAIGMPQMKPSEGTSPVPLASSGRPTRWRRCADLGMSDLIAAYGTAAFKNPLGDRSPERIAGMRSRPGLPGSLDVLDAGGAASDLTECGDLEGRVRFPQMIWTGGAATDWLDVDALARVSSNPLMIFKKAPVQV